MARRDSVLATIAFKAALIARRRAQAAILALATDSRRGKALRDNMQIRLEKNQGNSVDTLVHLPFYWAIYYHDGRNSIAKGTFMVFFRNPDEDPRIDGGSRNYPVRVTDIRPLTLTPERFRALARSGRIIITKRVGPTRAHPFFEAAGFRGLQKEVTPFAILEIERCIEELLTERDVFRPAEEEAVIRLL